MLQNFTRPVVLVYLAKGNPGMLRVISGLRAFLVAALMYPAIKMLGLNGAASSVLFAMLVFQFILINRVSRMTKLKTAHYWLPFFVALPLSLPIITVRYLLFLFFPYDPVLYLACGVGSIILTYVLVNAVHKRIKNAVKKILRIAEA
jgi:O-antigen/teichoic acid export membrane protein